MDTCRSHSIQRCCTPSSRAAVPPNSIPARPWPPGRIGLYRRPFARMPLALDDVTILDLSHALAGPFASTMLGDYGADIIKIEPLDGEIARAWGPPFYGDEAAYFVNLNRNKKSVALDLKQPDGRALFFRLLDRADGVLQN